MVEAISGAKPARQAILGDASNRNEKSDILTSCLLVGGVLFGHWRSDTLFPLVIRGATRRTVRKHRAPKGALRQLIMINIDELMTLGQKAPSAKRCIKTW